MILSVYISLYIFYYKVQYSTGESGFSPFSFSFLLLRLILIFHLILPRLERLQRIFSKVQMESGSYDDQLNHLETLLQTVSPVRVQDCTIVCST